MDLLLREYLMPKLLNSGIDIKLATHKHLYLMFMRSVKKAKEILATLPVVCFHEPNKVTKLTLCRLL